MMKISIANDSKIEYARMEPTTNNRIYLLSIWEKKPFVENKNDYFCKCLYGMFLIQTYIERFTAKESLDTLIYLQNL